MSFCQGKPRLKIQTCIRGYQEYTRYILYNYPLFVASGVLSSLLGFETQVSSWKYTAFNIFPSESNSKNGSHVHNPLLNHMTKFPDYRLHQRGDSNHLFGEAESGKMVFIFYFLTAVMFLLKQSIVFF